MSDKVCRYLPIAVFDADDATFIEKAREVATVLLAYFTQWTPDSVLPNNIDSVESNYSTEEARFRKKSNVEFIENFFAALPSKKIALEAYWGRLQAIETVNSVVVQDHVLDQWFSQNGVIHGNVFVVDLTPYQVNRILLHAALTLDQKWSKKFISSLIATTAWLLQPNSTEDSLALITLKKCYPEGFLINFLLVALVEQNDTEPVAIEALKKKMSAIITNILLNPSVYNFFNDFILHAVKNGHLNEILGVFQPYLPTWFQKKVWRDNFFSDFQNREASIDEKTQILTALAPHLGEWIQNAQHLRILFQFNLGWLSIEHRNQVWRVIKDRLATLTPDGSELIALFQLGPQQLSDTERTDILTALAPHLGEWIQSAQHLRELFELTLEQLSIAHRNQVWRAVKDQLATLIPDGSELVALFQLGPQQLSDTQRTDILTALAPRPGAWIQTTKQLREFLRLSDGQLSQDHRTKIWLMIRPYLPTLIKNLQELCALFEKLSSEQLSTTQRAEILTGLKSNLPRWVNKRQINALLSLPPEKLPDEQRQLILELKRSNSSSSKIQPNETSQPYLGALIQNREELMKLLNRPSKKRSNDENAQILHALDHQLQTLIESREQLTELFKLSKSCLSEANRDRILKVFETNPGRWIQDGEQLVELLQLDPLTELFCHQRIKILTALELKLETWIQDREWLIKLLKLGPRRLPYEGQTKVWSMVVPHLKTLIKDGKDLQTFFKLQPDWLLKDQRDRILSEIELELEVWIQDRDCLMNLLRLPLEQLSGEHRNKILLIAGPHLGRLMEGGRQLKNLFELSPEQLSDSQRTDILIKLQEQKWWTKEGKKSNCVLNLPLEKLSHAQRTLISQAQTEQLSDSETKIISQVQNPLSRSSKRCSDKTNQLKTKRPRKGEPIQLPSETQDSNVVRKQDLIPLLSNNFLFLSKQELLSILQDCQSVVDCSVVQNLRLLSSSRQVLFSFKDIGEVIEHYWFIKDVPDTILSLFGKDLDDCGEAYSSQELWKLKELGEIQSREDLKKILNAISVKFSEKLSESLSELTPTGLWFGRGAGTFFAGDEDANGMQNSAKRPHADVDSGEEETKGSEELNTKRHCRK